MDQAVVNFSSGERTTRPRAGYRNHRRSKDGGINFSGVKVNRLVNVVARPTIVRSCQRRSFVNNIFNNFFILVDNVAELWLLKRAQLLATWREWGLDHVARLRSGPPQVPEARAGHALSRGRPRCLGNPPRAATPSTAR